MKGPGASSADPTARAVTFAPVLVFLAYVAAGQLFGDAYPVSSFSMYARKARSHTSRLMAVAPDGRATSVRALEAWRCDRELDLRPEQCVTAVDFDVTTYLDDLDAAWLRDHADDPEAPVGDARVDLVRRVYALDAGGGPVTSTDCLIARCTAARTTE